MLYFHIGQVPYSVTIVDTPGFGDTRGIEQDEKITEQIRDFFNTSSVQGIDHLDAVCFVQQAGIARVTQSQKYVFDKVLSMFGKDIKENIVFLFTFADGPTVRALPSFQKARILEKNGAYFKFNNSALFADNSEQDSLDHYFWKMGEKSFAKFFETIGHLKSKNFDLSKEVLKERDQLENTILSFKDQIYEKVNIISRLQQKQQEISKQHAADINASKRSKQKKSVQKQSQICFQQLQAELYENQTLVISLLEEVQRILKRLSEIAMKENPLYETDYLNHLIVTEETEMKPGYQERRSALAAIQQILRENNASMV